MGICYSVIPQTLNIDNLHELDKNIILAHSFMKNKLNESQIKPYFTSFQFNQLLEEKSDQTKTRHFFKWIDMSTASKQVLFSIDIEHIISSLKKQKNKEENKIMEYGTELNKSEIIFKNNNISFTESALRQYYNKNKITFENRIFKAPPGIFRWISWIIIFKLPEVRSPSYYERLIFKKIKKKKKLELLLEIEDTVEDNSKYKDINLNELKASLFRILKSLILIDHEIKILKGLAYIIAYLLIISNNDELNVYYFMISLLSKTFHDKFCLRGFYTQEQPLLIACISIFQKNFDKYFPELSEHFKEINLPFYSWISLWIQMIYINVFPNYLLLRVWDNFLTHGISFLLNLGLSIIEFFYEDLINNDYPEEILEIFKKLNPNLKSHHKKVEIIDYNIEQLLNNVIKNYNITDDEINSELQILFPNYNNNLKYEYEDKTNKIIIRKSLSLDEESKESIYKRSSFFSETITDSDNQEESKLNSSSLYSFSNNTYTILEENINENIQLSISQNNGFTDIYYSEDSCEEIEDEDIYIHEHIKDLMSKQASYNKNSNLIK